ncbi:MAG: hypothetical protein KGN77_06285 [Xanthomonadaceae bacterium]|nr:hypothetical protein [Xanthomonadaceae bacterium]MDE1965572.1 hypothetical protein [Xanthomonadaceae bacterium]
MRKLGWIAACLLLPASAGVLHARDDVPRPAEVVVLSTLHRMHAEVSGYAFERLGEVIRQLHPDVLCLEVRADRLAARAPEATKQEYPKVIYPLLARRHIVALALEPSEPEYGAIVRPYARAQAAFQASGSAAVAALEAYSDATYAALKTHWRDAATVNGATTDTMLRAKHAFQQAAIGDAEREGWERWNRHFLGVIEQAAAAHPGQRIVVTVGVEHAYWLREHLAGAPSIRLRDTAALLAPALMRPD